MGQDKAKYKFVIKLSQAGPDLPIATIVGIRPFRAIGLGLTGIWGPTDTNLSRKNDPLMSLAYGPQVGKSGPVSSKGQNK